MVSTDPIPHWERGAWHRWTVLRWLYRWLIRRGIWYVTWSGQEEQLWREAMRHAPLSFRLLRRSLSVAEIDAAVAPDWSAWNAIKEQLRPGDRIWPFIVNPWTMAMRAGYVVVRQGKAVGGFVTTLS